MIFSLVLVLQLAARKEQDSAEAVVVGSGVRIQNQIKQMTSDCMLIKDDMIYDTR